MYLIEATVRMLCFFTHATDHPKIRSLPAWNFRGEHPSTFGLCLPHFSPAKYKFWSRFIMLPDILCKIWTWEAKSGSLCLKEIWNVKLQVWWTHFDRSPLPSCKTARYLPVLWPFVQSIPGKMKMYLDSEKVLKNFFNLNNFYFY